MAFSPQLQTNDELSKTHTHATLQPGGNSRNFSFTPGSPLQHWSRKAPPPGFSVFRTKKKPAANFSFHDAAGKQQHSGPADKEFGLLASTHAPLPELHLSSRSKRMIQDHTIIHTHTRTSGARGMPDRSCQERTE
ncbi:hypothetical protein IscW_ISCW022636 [Ixodes scapularis]|uniref:Uncharacterized protein n=1 Tax=Ixodes scapularis TaxID=6945 RepID=B7QDT1_IXOSC|nr:hypothetical protein IscW_ISCW022636 [Ixodes scapularis]|eukprot:XP_002413695.1 hypothetical protein IscW_ISCW022636 [Ixodes scapularis]